MKAIAVNGSPRKDWNTATLLKKSLEGAASAGAETEMVHLYDLDFKGCLSCFACKRKASRLHGICAIRDDLTEVLKKVISCDVLLLGSPIYLGSITGEMKSFIERLVFANLSYDSPERTAFTGKIHTGFLYTMGIPHERVESSGYQYIFDSTKNYLQLLKGHSEYIVSADNYQFDDYSKYAASNFDEKHKAEVKRERFPRECQQAFEMGERLARLCKNS